MEVFIVFVRIVYPNLANVGISTRICDVHLSGKISLLSLSESSTSTYRPFLPQNVVKLHFDTTLKKQNQPHTLALHLDFLRRTDIGNATFTVKDVKLGRQTSIVHVTLSQGEREEVVG